ncbi:MAG: glycosyltransferase [Nitrososphaerales archaeon]|nr:glycosyltransferase [Nitrososphaerales archaeon]
MREILGVVILTRNSARMISQCLGSICRNSVQPYITVIVDGGSSDQTLEIVGKFKDRLRLKILSDERKGLGYAREIGRIACETHYVAMVDSDVLVPPDFFKKALNILTTEQYVGAVAAKLKPIQVEDGWLARFQVKNLAIHLHWEEPVFPTSTIAVHTACTIFRNSWLQTINGFDSFFRLAKEDSDISFRLRKTGVQLVYIDEYAEHLERTRLWRTNFRYGRSYVHIAQKHPVEAKLWTKKNILFTAALLILPLQLLVYGHYLRRYCRLKDLTKLEKFILPFIEVLRQDARTAGMLYELIKNGMGR